MPGDAAGPPPLAGGPVIALVSSAGGIEATTTILAGLPATLSAAIVVLVHQKPSRPPVALRDVLAPHTDLPVVAARAGDRLEPGRVVVVPAGSHLLTNADRTLTLIPVGPFPPPRPSADLLLSTLAVAVGPSATAVILSGAGHDGATGATAIHEYGGTVIATDESSSQVFGMPRATIERDHITDHVCDLQDVAALLVRLDAPR